MTHLERAIENAVAGLPVVVNSETRMGHGCKGSQWRGGVLEFWYNHEVTHVFRLVTMDRYYRKTIMDRLTKNSRNLKGDKYFIWKPYT